MAGPVAHLLAATMAVALLSGLEGRLLPLFPGRMRKQCCQVPWRTQSRGP